VGDTLCARLVKWKSCIFIEQGWNEFAQVSGVAKRDTLFFTYTVGCSMKIVIFEGYGCKKIPERN
jgi:hypothetical protein